MGDLYFNGIGVKRDTSEGVNWYRKAAENGNEDAQFYLGFMYYKGEMVEKNISEGIGFLREKI